MRETIDKYMASENLPHTIDGVREAVNNVAHVMNTMSFVRGFTPAQWVLNTNPRDPTSLTTDDFSFSVHHDVFTDPEFGEEVQKRYAARMAFMKADADARVRRALLRRHRALKAPLVVGQICYFWREAGAPRLQKNRWKGPATVVMREDNHEGKPTCYWLVHGTSLVRCAPEHVRPDVEQAGESTLQARTAAAEQALQDIRSRSTTQYADLRASAGPPLDVDSDDDHEMELPIPAPPPPPPEEPATPARTPARSTPEQPEQEITPEARPLTPFNERRRRMDASETTVLQGRIPEPPPNIPVPTTAATAGSSAAPSAETPEAPTTTSFEEQRRRMDAAETAVLPGTSNVQYGPAREPTRIESGPYLIDGVTMDEKDMSEVGLEGWKFVDGVFVLDVMNLSERSMKPDERAAFMEAKRKELKSFFDNQVWEYTDHSSIDPGRVMRARFVLKWRPGPDGTPEAKARLVLQGFKDPDALSGNLQTSSPTAMRVTRQTLLTIAAVEGWPLAVADVKTAFLQGKPQGRALYVKLPADAAHMLGIPDTPFMRLVKPMYGQVDAPREWFLAAKDRMLRCGHSTKFQSYQFILNLMIYALLYMV